MIFVKAGKPVLHTLTFVDPNSSNAPVTGKVYADLSGVVLGYYSSAGVRTTVTASSYLTLTEESGGEYRLRFTPDAGLGDRWWFLHFTYPTGTQEFLFTARYWVGSTKQVLQTGDSVYLSLYLNDPSGTAVTGEVLGNFQAANLNRIANDGTAVQTDEDASLTLTEVGSGYYTLSFTPASGEAGTWGLSYIEPVGTEEREGIETFYFWDGVFSSRIAEIVADAAGHAVGQYPNILANALTSALREYSSYFPLKVLYTFAGDGTTFDIPTASLSAWVNGWSSILSIEHPAGNRVPEYLRPGSGYIEYEGTGGRVIRLLEVTPATGSNALVRYKAIHGDTSTVPDGHLEAVFQLGAADMLRSLSNLSVQEHSVAMGAEAMLDMQTRSGQYANNGEALRNMAIAFLRRLRGPEAIQVRLSGQNASPFGDGISLTHEDI